MPSTGAPRPVGGLVDRRLVARASVTRRYLVLAVAIGVASTICVVAQAVLLATVIDQVVHGGATLTAVTGHLVALGGVFVLRAGLGWLGELAAQRTSATVTSTLRRQLLSHALELGPTWLAGERAGELSVTATRGTTALDNYFGRYLPVAVVAGIAPLGILAWVAYNEWWAALLLLGLVALVPVAMILFGREATKRTRRQWHRLSSLSSRYLEVIQGLATLRAFRRAQHGRREVVAATEALRQTTMGTLRIAFLSALAMEFLAGIGVGLVAMVLGLGLLAGTVSFYTALAVLLVSPEVFLPLRRAGAEFHASTEGQAAAERILEVLDLPTDASEPRSGVSLNVGRPPVLAARALSVTYPGRSAPALGPLDLRVSAGEHVVIVGPSGSGKSTLLASLLGFVEPSGGSLCADGTPLGDLDRRQWRSLVAWMPQRPHLFTGTIAQNLALGDPGATRGALEAACELTGLAALVAQLPAGLDTPVGEGGLSLSAGERQRLALARVVVRGASIVLLDEPGAHLDLSSELAIGSALTSFFEDRTVIVAAHRQALVSRVDRVVRLGQLEGVARR
jgi:thiol reductant ABC exporter CydD subunit